MPKSLIKKIRMFFSPDRPSIPEHKGHHDLNILFNELNLAYFQGSLALKVSWTGRGKTKTRTVLRLGYYNQKTEAIFVNRILDKEDTPHYFLSYILYHEILHHIYPPIKGEGGRRRIHHKKFLEKEKEFHDYEKAQEFLLKLKKTHFKQ